MRFSEDDENQAAFERGLIPALCDVGIRRPPRTISLTHGLARKITSQVLSSRFNVAKVDAKRLNIYYVLGLSISRPEQPLPFP